MVEVFYGSKSQKQKKLSGSEQSPAIPAPAANSCNQKIVSFHSIPLWGGLWSKLVLQVGTDDGRLS